jgi:hypothetical protein
MKTDDLNRAHAAVSKAEAYVSRCGEELATAVAEDEAAKATYDKTQTDADQDLAARAHVRRDSKERRLAAAREALSLASAEVAQLQRARDEQERATTEARLRAWADTLSAPIARLVTSAAQASEAVDAIAIATVGAMRLHAHYVELCGALGVAPGVVAPDLATAKHKAREAITAARAKAGAEDVSSWLASLVADWKTAGMSATEIAAAERARTAVQQQEIFEAGRRSVQAAAPPPAPEPKAEATT